LHWFFIAKPKTDKMEPTMFTSIPIQTLVNMITEAVVKSLTTEPTINNINKQDKLLTRKQTAKMLQVSLPTLNLWTKRGIIKAKRINSRVRYAESDVQAALKSYNKYIRI
jgi:predicted DNA-binding transcriptional regulator AlpA